jgi:hypothetical protein
MNPITPPALAGHIPLLIEGVCGVIAQRGAGGWFAVPSIVAIWSRLRRLGARLAAARRRPPLPPMSRSVARLVRKMPEAERIREKLHYVLWQPETAALVAANPQARRTLRLLCRMLGVTPPPGLFVRRSPGAPGSGSAASGPQPIEGRTTRRRRDPERARLVRS